MPSGPAVQVTSTARTATGVSGTLDAPSEAATVLAFDCTAVSGTSPTCTLSVEWSQDGGTTFCVADTADAFTEITAAASKVKAFTTKGNAYRVRWTIGGTTPSFTFSVREMGF